MSHVTSRNQKFISSKTYSKSINNDLKLIQKNNKQIASILLSSKIDPPHLSHTVKCINLLSKEMPSENSIKKLTSKSNRLISEIISNPELKSKTLDTNPKLKNFYISSNDLFNLRKKKSFDKKNPSNLTLRQDISHILDSSFRKPSPKKYISIKDRSPSFPLNSFKPEDEIKIRMNTAGNENFIKHLSNGQRILNSQLSERNYDININESLKKELPTINSCIPSGRQEVLILKEWLESKIKLNEIEENNIQKKNNKLWDIYSACYLEVCRQVLFECNERGELMQKLYGIIKEIRINEQNELKMQKSKLDDMTFDEYNRVHNMYRKEITQKDLIINSIKEELNLLKLVKKNLEIENKRIEQREDKINNENRDLKKVIIFYKKKLKLETSENEKLLLKLESRKSPKETSKKPQEIESSSESSKENSKEENFIIDGEDQNEAILNDLNQIIITNIPEKRRSELYNDVETEITNELKEMYLKDIGTQCELVMMDSIFNKTLISNKAAKEMAEDYLYKLELEEDEIMKKLDMSINKKQQENVHNKEEIELIKKKLEDYKNKHKEKNNIKEEDSPMDKLKGALSKIKLYKILTGNDNEEHPPPDDSQKSIGNIEKEIKEYETEEEESEGEAKNDDKRQNNIIKELNEEQLGSDSTNSDKKEKEIHLKPNKKKRAKTIQPNPHKTSLEEEDNDKEISIKKKIFPSKTQFIDNETSKKNINEEMNQNFNNNDLNEIKEEINKSDESLKNFDKIESIQKMNSFSDSNSSKSEINSAKLKQKSILKKKSSPNHSISISRRRSSVSRSSLSSPKLFKIANINRPSFKNIDDDNYNSSSSPNSSTKKSKTNVFFSEGKKRNDKSHTIILKEIESDLLQGIEGIPDDIKKNDLLKTLKEGILADSNENKPINQEKFLRLMILYKTENKKFNITNEKYQRNNDLLEMESLARKNLEEKHNELLKNFNNLQDELLKCQGREKERIMKEIELEKENKENAMFSSTIIQKNSEQNIPLRKELKRSTRKRNLKPNETVAVAPKLGQKVVVEYNSINTNAGIQLMEKIKSKPMKKFQNFMHIKLILKQINLIYLERISSTKESDLCKQQYFSNEIYNYYLGLFGLKKIADRRFIIYVLSLKKYVSYFRINMFSRFMGLFEDKINYNLEELNKYIEALDFCTTQSSLGVPITNSDSEPKFFIPYIRALQYTGLFADTRMSPEENQELKKEIENLKESDPKGLNKAGIIDFDLFMERMLTKYRLLVNKAKTYVINAFAASDLDGNGMCNLEEFLLLNRHIEKAKYNQDNLEKIFLEYADIDNEGEKNLSFDKFSVVCVDYNLFSDESQDKYLCITKKSQLEIRMEEAKTMWFLKKNQITEIMNNLTIISEAEKENWKKIIDVLDERIMGENTKLLKPTLIAYNILIQECDLLVKSQEDHDKGEYEDNLEDEYENFEN